MFKTIDNTWRGNFFKCGDDCEYEHYLSWSNIPYEEKNFHRTECFGEIKNRHNKWLLQNAELYKNKQLAEWQEPLFKELIQLIMLD